MGDDNDSALGESIAGSLYTASLTSSVFNYTYENGRRYHAYHAGNYVLPNDEQEQDRLEYTHHLYRLLVGGASYRAPLLDHRPQRILDIGCGTGIWCIDVADEFPESSVIGVDLSPIQPSWVPPNCRFYVDDIEREWTYSPAEHFDYIHARDLIGFIGPWKQLLSHIFDNLKPGGFFEIQDCTTPPESIDSGLDLVPDLVQWQLKMFEGMAMLGKESPGDAYGIQSYMTEVGFVDTHVEIHKVPIGPWAQGNKHKELGLILQEHVSDSVEPYTMAVYTRALGFSAEDAQATVERVKNNIQKTEAHLYLSYYFLWGQKPF
ncbi:hypothetical protein LTR84_002127 [Exophiala bonariae]|uniref:Methyltransferase domain-containing protein n=1 Tax=Exophiala bonariae TaxID=1690606 RepID=A0AAV9NA92_9EURO|nr:hypothetical protein LTR84_002127 [Exophiala bonariae]